MGFHNLRSVFAFAFMLFIFTGALAPLAHAETKIAVVDVESILVSSKAAKSIKEQVDQKRKSFLADVKTQEDKLRVEQQKIESKRDELSKEELVEKAQEFEKRRIEARNTLEKKKSALDVTYSKAMNELTKAITAVCQDIADEQALDLIITRQNIIIGSNSLDITSDVLKRMDKKLPSVTLK